MKAVVLCSLLLCSACQCGTRLRPSEGGLSASPSVLDFGLVPLGERVDLRLEISSSARATSALAASTAAPFEVRPVALEVGGGVLEPLTVSFRPSGLGPVSGTVTLHADGFDFEAELRGEGGPPCARSGPCRVSTFELETRSCSERIAADDGACETACVASGVCRAGLCVGSALACEDEDRCTIDACAGDGGCVHVPRECPVTDPCQVASCDPRVGCITRDVEDGVLCGESTCEEARVCITGRCTTRLRPGALDFCRFTEVSAAYARSCGLTRSGAMRCWGRSLRPQDWNPIDSPAVLPGLEGGVSRVFAPVCAALGGTTRCLQGDGGLAVTRSVLDMQEALTGARCELFPGGAVECDGAVVADAGVARIAMLPFDGACLQWEDGGVDCAGYRVLFDEPPVELSSSFRSVCARLPSGRVQCTRTAWFTTGPGPLDEVADGGALALGGWTGGPGYAANVCWASSGGRVDCVENGVASSLMLPGEVSSLTKRGNAHLCALLDGGKVHCWGDNGQGQLGARSVQPEGVQVVPLPLARALGAGGGRFLAEALGGLWTWGRATPRFDGVAVGGITAPPALLEVTGPLLRLAVSDGQISCLQVPSREVRCWGAGPANRVVPLHPVASAAAELTRFGTSTEGGMGVGHDATVWRWAYAGLQGGTATSERARAADQDCLTLLDGGVSCGYSVAPSGPVVDVGQQCALLASGGVECWTFDPVSGVSPVAAPITGLSAPVRRAVGNSYSGCAISGTNGVQCWGSNQWGSLGRDGPPSPRAVDVAMPEPVRELVFAEGAYCVLLQSGQVRCWGANHSGQLGLVPVTHSLVPIEVD